LLETSKLPLPFPLTLSEMALVPIRFKLLAPATRLPVIETRLDGLPATPMLPAGPAALVLPPIAWMPAPLGKLLMMLFAIDAAVRLTTTAAVPRRLMLMPLPFKVAVDVELVIVLLEMLALAFVPLPLR